MLTYKRVIIDTKNIYLCIYVFIYIVSADLNAFLWSEPASLTIAQVIEYYQPLRNLSPPFTVIIVPPH